ncbi:hypothetical protein [Streptomyces sp. NPDC001508]|uniref:hypothetical protein n=1 Tax=Streptomyces sp. NPDC001508 TaxID=3154656 RepID=UPI00332D84D8
MTAAVGCLRRPGRRPPPRLRVRRLRRPAQPHDAVQYLAATAVALITQPERLKAIKAEFAERTTGITWKTALPDGYEPPMYEPPSWSLKKTRQSWPQDHITWPPRRIVSDEQFSSRGPEPARQT